MFTPPPLTGDCCSCDDCRVAGVTDKPVVRAPNGELHGRALAEWYTAREKAVQALERFRFVMRQRGMR